ncbi:AHH domain-containing protein [Aeromonas hydrophila]|uniref:AHH domain-containing protein n=1 Tax=Aeromonas hydrophila TaxID=644 RepID=UPI002B467F77|nr:RHS repeat-associated core domain-containing protein [Aeromonas hydrophila]
MGFIYIEQGRQAAAESWQTDFAVSQQNGELLGLYNPQGELHWQPTKTSLWGLRLSKHADIRDPGLAFAGQLRDDKSGLCYNRFRYYDPQGACYITPDPIGIFGGENNYGYVPNPVNWVDPLGLAGCSTKLGKNMMEDMGLPRSTKWGGYQAHHVIPKELASHPALKKIKYNIDEAGNGIFLREVDNNVSSMARHQGNHHGYTDAMRNALNKIDLSQPTSAILKQINKIQCTAKQGLMNGSPIRSKDMWNADIFGKDVGQVGRQRVLDLWDKILGG